MAQGWRGRYTILSGYTDMLLSTLSAWITKEKDLEALLTIATDRNNQTAERVLACFARGLASWDRSDRNEAARMYQRALTLADGASAAEREQPLWITVSSGESGPGLYRQKAGKLIDFHAALCRSNLATITGTDTSAAHSADDLTMSKCTSWPIDASSSADATHEMARMDNAMRVRRNECAQCGTIRSTAGVALKVCTRCGLLWYCSRECQRAHWTAVHKHQCRNPTDFRPGDVVRLINLDQDRALQDHFFLVVEPVASVQDGWKVAHARFLPAHGKIVRASNMQRVLTE